MMQAYELNDLMFSPELFTVYVSVNNTLRKQVFELPPPFNFAVTKLCTTWISTGYGELAIRSAMDRGKIQVVFSGCPSHIYYVDKNQLANLKTFYESLSNAAMERGMHQT